MRFGVLGLSLAAAAAAAAPAEPVLKIVTRETLPALIIETVEYVHTDRSRQERRVTYTGLDPLGRQSPDGGGAVITRCDSNRIIVLDFAERTYHSVPLYGYPRRVQIVLASLASWRPRRSKAPDLLIETTTTDTGERKTAFGYFARRVITRERRIPLKAGRSTTSEMETDGWYIDLEPAPPCGRSKDPKLRTVLTAVAVSGPGRFETPTVTFREVGAPERGFPIDVTTTRRSTAPSADPAMHEHALVTRKLVTEITRERLDPALFEIPDGLREADGPTTGFAVRLSHGMQALGRLLASVFR